VTGDGRKESPAGAGPRLGRNVGSFADENVPIRTQERKSPGRGNDRGKVSGIVVASYAAYALPGNS
jgi:hypothetical protein